MEDIALHLHFDHKVLFPYCYLDEELESKDGSEDDYLYFVLLGDKKRIIDVSRENEIIVAIVHNETSNSFISYYLSFQDGCDNIRNCEIVDSGCALEFTYTTGETGKLPMYRIPEYSMMQDCSLDKYEVLYIGKSGTGRQSLYDRLVKHETISRISRDMHKTYPSKELYLLVTGLESSHAFHGTSPERMEQIFRERKLGSNNADPHARHNEEKGIAEALLIKLFKPKYNFHYSNNRPLDRSEYFVRNSGHEIDSITLSIDLHFYDGSYIGLFTDQAAIEEGAAQVHYSESSSGERGNIWIEAIPQELFDLF